MGLYWGRWREMSAFGFDRNTHLMSICITRTFLVSIKLKFIIRMWLCSRHITFHRFFLPTFHTIAIENLKWLMHANCSGFRIKTVVSSGKKMCNWAIVMRGGRKAHEFNEIEIGESFLTWIWLWILHIDKIHHVDVLGVKKIITIKHVESCVKYEDGEREAQSA